MNENADIASLARWDLEDLIPDGVYEQVYARPNFVAAMRQFSRNMLEAAVTDRGFDGIAKDGGRYVATSWALYLDATGGLTLPRLKEMCAASGVLSPGRARAVLLFLRYLRYIEVAPAQPRGGPVLYRPTKALIDTWRLMMRQRLKAARLFEPAVDLAIGKLDDPKVLEGCFVHMGKGMFEVATKTEMNSAFIDIFLHKHAGIQLVHMINASADADDDFAPRKPVPITIAAIARQLNVSRTHVKRVLSAAEKEGLLSGADTGALILNEPMRFAMRYVLTTTLMGNLIVAAKVVRERPELFRPEPALVAAK